MNQNKSLYDTWLPFLNKMTEIVKRYFVLLKHIRILVVLNRCLPEGGSSVSGRYLRCSRVAEEEAAALCSSLGERSFFPEKMADLEGECATHSVGRG